MNHLVSRPLRSARLILPAAVLLTVLGGTAATAAPVQAGLAHGSARTAQARPATRARAAVKLTWHRLKLINGWKSASTSGLVTGAPAWALRDGVVYLRGAIKRSGVGSATFAELPKEARPARDLYIQVFTSSDVPGILFADPAGILDAYDGNSATFTSLSGVSYPIAPVKSRKLTLEHGWTSSQSVYDTGNPSYAVSRGVVYLSGSMHTSGTSDLATVLPKAARPAHQMYVSVYTFDGSTGWLHILPNGQVEALGGGAAEYTSFANVSYPAVGAKWHSIALEGGWKSGRARFHTAAPAYAVIGGVVYLTGSMYQGPSGTTGLWADLPSATRTPDVLEIEVYTSGGTAGAVAITSSLGLVSSMPFSNARAFTSLASIAYPQKA